MKLYEINAAYNWWLNSSLDYKRSLLVKPQSSSEIYKLYNDTFSGKLLGDLYDDVLFIENSRIISEDAAIDADINWDNDLARILDEQFDILNDLGY